MGEARAGKARAPTPNHQPADHHNGESAVTVSGGPRLERATFTTSRLLDFFAEKELTAQTGHGKADWPLVILKELADNALDACEEAGIAPAITVTVDDAGITVADNGPGIPAETIGKVLDYSVRVSSREAYAAPDRGAQGNALKTIMAMPFVLDGTEGHVTVTARGVKHEISVTVDPIRQEPVIDHDQQSADASPGSSVTVRWPDSASWIRDRAKERFFQLAEDYLCLNPHLTLSVDWSGENIICNMATAPDWPKWKPSDPTSAHWYTPATFERLVAAYVSDPAHAAMSVREFISQFRGLSSTAKGKQVLAATGLARTSLASLANGKLDSETIALLLDRMKAVSRPVKPAQLGVIGREHLAWRMKGYNAEMESFNYKKTEGERDGQPFVIETAFAWCPDLGGRRLITGVNWSPGVKNPFRQLGQFGQSLDAVLQRQRADEDCALVVHVTRPVVAYADRGKSSVVL
jgi:DNA topoisomerase VI subunit B